MAADFVRDVNSMDDKDRIFYTRKAMVLCGLALVTNEKWEVSQLKHFVQIIVRKQPELFDNPHCEGQTIICP